MTNGPQQGPINPQLQAMIQGMQQGKQAVSGPASGTSPTGMPQATDPAGPALKDSLAALQKAVDILTQLNNSEKDVMKIEKAKMLVREAQQARVKVLEDRAKAMQDSSAPSPAQPAGAGY
jgi:hypothetical protein